MWFHAYRKSHPYIWFRIATQHPLWWAHFHYANTLRTFDGLLNFDFNPHADRLLLFISRSPSKARRAQKKRTLQFIILDRRMSAAPARIKQKTCKKQQKIGMIIQQVEERMGSHRERHENYIYCIYCISSFQPQWTAFLRFIRRSWVRVRGFSAADWVSMSNVKKKFSRFQGCSVHST